MKKILLAICLMILGVELNAQSIRLSLYEEFTGENCNPCAGTNPGLNALLAIPSNTVKIVPIKWQVPIPSAPSNTWSLYQTDKTEIDWRWKTGGGAYGYNPPINSAPSSKIDGQEATAFGAVSSHPGYLTSNVITSAQSYTSAFTITMTRAWNKTCSAVTLTVNIQATANFSAVGPLVFRTVMVERLIQFATSPGSNGEMTFEDVAIKSFPTLQAGISMASNWTVGQTQTFTLNCPIPSYTRKKTEIAFVGFIQDDGNQKVAQAARADKQALPSDAISAPAAKVDPTCSNTIAPVVTIQNDGTANPITGLTLTPHVDGVVGAPTIWTGNIAPGTSANITLNSMSTGTNLGAHTFSCDVDANLSQYDFSKNATKVSYLVASSYMSGPVVEGFLSGIFPPAKWTAVNPDGGPSWSKTNSTGGFGNSTQSAKYDFFNNTVIGDVDELYLPPMDLSGSDVPILLFDVAYAQRDETSMDQLDVLASSDCGQHWTNLYSAAGAALVSTAPPSTTPYIPDPFDIFQWKTVPVNMTGFNSANVLVKFVATNANGNNMYIDNINLSQANSSTTGLAKLKSQATNVSVFPNPSSGVTNIKINAVNAGTSKVSVINTLGQVVFEKQLQVTEGSNTLQLDVKEYTNGIYYITVADSNNGTIVKKLTVNK